MAFARVVSFDGVSSDHMADMTSRMGNEPPPEGLDATELLLLHDPENGQALAIVFFEDEDAYRRGHEILDSMPADDTPGHRASVSKYAVAHRVSL
jgi:hypothetical protein